jgi:hypothetical protein
MGLTGCSVLFNIFLNTANIVCEKTNVKHILVISSDEQSNGMTPGKCFSVFLKGREQWKNKTLKRNP